MAALEFESPEQRAAYLESSCGTDAELRRDVERLLRSHQEAGAFLERPAMDIEATLMAEGAPQDLAAVMHAGLAHAFKDEQAVVVGSGGVSVLKRFDQTIDLPRVMLREASPTGAEPIVRPKSAETPATGGDSRYRLDGEIARGGMGAILKGRDTDLGRELAIKVLLEAHKDKPEVIQRFIEEAQIGGQLQHPGIAPVYELGQFADRRPFFSMKLVKGETLSKLLADRVDPSADRSRLVGIFEQVCQTMAYAHNRGVIHRDLKPANIMVGAFGEVQVMDWVLAKVLMAGGVADEKKARDKGQVQSVIKTLRNQVGSDVAGSIGTVGSQTQMGSVMGTPAYMPPEQALGEIDNLDERADVFGLGAILCEILTGKPPYVGDDGTQVFRMASRGKLGDCFARLDACGADPELIALTRHCLEVEPSDRPRDAGVLAERVTSYLESVETKLRAAEAARAEEALHTVAQTEARAKAERRARRLQLTMAAAAVALATVGGLYMTWTAMIQTCLKNSAVLAEKSAQQARLAAVAAAKREQQLASDARASEERESQLRQQAEDREQTIQETLYAAEMNLAGQAAEKAAGLRRVAQTVENWAPERAVRDLRGWEWSYLDSLQHGERLTCKNPGSICLRWSADGRNIYCAGRDMLVRVWEAATGRPVSEMVGHTSYTHDISLSPDGSRIATASRDKTVRIWDVATGRPCAPVLSVPEVVNTVCWSPDGAKVALKGDEKIVIGNATSSERVAEWRSPLGENRSLCWNPHTDQLACNGGVIDAETGVLLWTHRGGESDWNPDGKHLAVTVGSDVQILSASDGTPGVTLTGHVDKVNGVRWSPDGEYLVPRQN
jgi:tRNA A-37 threonylcarbamoyl transferase component Bud32